MRLALHELDGVPVQMILVDTPGIFAPKRRLDRAMVEAAWSGAGDADFVAFILWVRVSLSSGLHALTRENRSTKPLVYLLSN